MIRFSGARVRYPKQDRDVVCGVDLHVARGETTVLLGRSGSGKTTLLRTVNRMVALSGGDVSVDGRSLNDWDAIALRRNTGYIIQEGGLLPHYTVARNIGLVPELAGDWSRQRIDARVRELLELMQLPAAVADRYPHQLSGGQRQRVGVARALAADPPLLLCDEPFAALDPITRSELQRTFLHLATSLGKTILFVTHDVSEALLLASSIVLMRDGEIVFHGDGAALRESDNAEAEAFLASVLPVSNTAEAAE